MLASNPSIILWHAVVCSILLLHKPCAVPGLTSLTGPLCLGPFSADTTLALIPPWGSSNRQSHLGDDGSKVQVIFFLAGPVEKVSTLVCMRKTPRGRGRGCLYIKRWLLCVYVHLQGSYLVQILWNSGEHLQKVAAVEINEGENLLSSCLYAGPWRIYQLHPLFYGPELSSILRALTVNQLNHVTNTCFNQCSLAHI